jgi:hypothetical protein
MTGKSDRLKRVAEDLLCANHAGQRHCTAFPTVEPETQEMPQDMQADTEVISHSTPLKALRQHCLWCCNGSYSEVRLCAAQSCPLWPFRHGHRPNDDEKAAVTDRQIYPIERRMTGASPLRAIRRRCVDCSGANDAEVRSCAYGPNHSAPAHSIHFGPAQTHSLPRGLTSGGGQLPSAWPRSRGHPCRNRQARTRARRARQFWRGNSRLDKCQAGMPPLAGLRQPSRCFSVQRL